jgi:hypothetical protein
MKTAIVIAGLFLVDDTRRTGASAIAALAGAKTARLGQARRE